MRFTLLLILMLSFSVSAHTNHQFKYFKLKSDYEARLAEQGISTRGANGVRVSSIFEKLWTKIKDEGLKQVNKLTEDILKYNHEFKLGDFNTPGIDWKSSVDGEFEVMVGRRVDPTIDSDVWQVRDVLEVMVSASTFLKQMRDGGIIDITDEKLKLFADISFKRTYTYHHFASSYKKGLTTNFSKLFLGFNYFRDTNFLDINQGEVIAKDDYLGANLKLSVSSPSIYFMSGQGKGSVYMSKLNTLSYHRPMERDRYGDNDVLRASRSTTKITGASLQIDLQADFYSLLTITILGAEYKVDMTKSSVTNMTFGESDIEDMKTDKELKKGLNKLNQGQHPDNIEILKNFITSSEVGNRLTEQLELYAMIWGKHLGSATEEIVFNSDQGINYLYRHLEERIKIVKSFWDGLFRSKNISKFNEREIENVTFEYQAYGSDIPFEELNLELPANISFRISKEYKTKKDGKKYRKKVLSLIDTFENIDGGIVLGVQDGTLKGPYTLDFHGQVGNSGIDYLINMDLDVIDKRVGRICSESSEEQKCLDKLQSLYRNISSNFLMTKTVNLSNLKSFLQAVSSYSKNFKALKVLFGDENVQLYGYLKSKTEDNREFQTFFKEGESQGFGVIKDFLRLNHN